MIRRLVLWDVDGTLVRAGDVGGAVFDDAMEAALGRRPDGRVRMSGKTDPQIVREYLTAMAIDGDHDTLVATVLVHLETALARSQAEIASAGQALPGVAALLERLAGDPTTISTLLTGNIAPNAVVKLAAFGLDRFIDFAAGAYGSDHPDRNALVPVALGRVAERYEVDVDPDAVWVVGDTPRDLACARAGGVRCLLVGTGRYRAEELADLGADEVRANLADVDDVMRILMGEEVASGGVAG